jgi:pilus assembly protein CpaF
MEGDVVMMNDVFQFEVTGEGAEGRLQGRYKVSPARPAAQERLVYFGLDREWMAALEQAGQ